MEVIVGTAGHIDHGKTALVMALTGVDTDRLPEEKRRGITIDLGFAELAAGDTHFGFVDVPGHERFVKNMLAGASGIDIVLLVVAADEGVMPQTREHFDICQLLRVQTGLIALTKCDLVDSETLELARQDLAELVAGSFLANGEVIAVSSRTGVGIEELRNALTRVSASVPAREDLLVTRLPVDRSFSMKGFGTVVTGTLASGTINERDEMELLPDGIKVRVRGIQTHGRSVKYAAGGQRVAVNLAGVDHSAVVRGMTLGERGILRPTKAVDAQIAVLAGTVKPVRSRQRLRVHVGTAEVLARIQVLNGKGEIAPGESAFAQMKFETAIVAVPGERFIIRSYTPQMTIAGGRIVDTFPTKHRRREFELITKKLDDHLRADNGDAGSLLLLINTAGGSALTMSDLQARSGLRKEIISAAIADLIFDALVVDARGHYVDSKIVDSLASAAKMAIANFYKKEPVAKGMPLERLRNKVFARVPGAVTEHIIRSLEDAGEIVSEKDIIRLASHQPDLSPGETVFIEKVRHKMQFAGLEVPRIEELIQEAAAGLAISDTQRQKLFRTFLDSGELVKVGDEFFFLRVAIDELAMRLKLYADTSVDRLIDVAKFKDIAGVSRKYAIPLLEYFDRERVTVRSGDKRLILE